jgi:hypothetical protein
VGGRFLVGDGKVFVPFQLLVFADFAVESRIFGPFT